MSLRLMIGFIVIALSSLTPLGCGGQNFSPEDFKKVVNGMSEAQVKEILGNPTETYRFRDFKFSIWQIDDKYYTAAFAEGKAFKHDGPIHEDEIDEIRKILKEHHD